MSNEIKVGDKVRVSSKLPKIYERFGARIAPEHECKVIEIDEGMALLDSIPAKYVFLFPLKYLIKVEDEAKEPKFKVNDVVRTVFDEITHVTSVLENGNYYLYGMGNEYPEDSLTLVEPYTEPTEQTEAEYTKTKGDTLTFPIAFDLNEALEGCDCFVSIREQMRKTQRDMEENNKPRYVPKIMFNTEFWVKYEADLAKEVTLKVANKFNDPKEAAEYAVSVAKAVVEGLKKQ